MYKRQTLRLSSADGLDFQIERLVQDVAIEKEQGAERLVLRGGSNILIDGEIGQEGLHLGRPHLLGMALVVEEDEAPDPVGIGLAGARRVVHQADGVIHLFEQLLGTRFCAHFGAGQGLRTVI